MQNYSIDTGCRKHLIIILIIISYILNSSVNYILDFLYNLVKQIVPSLSGTISTLELFGISFNQISILGIFGLLYTVYVNWLWKIKIIKNIHNIPDLNGIWIGTLQSSFNEKTIPMKMEIIQNWDKITCKSFFNESSSSSQMASIHIDDIEGITIQFSYRNTSKNVKLKGREYTGFNRLIIKDDTLSGIYFTNREEGTHGTILLKKYGKNK